MGRALEELASHRHEQLAIFHRPDAGLTAIIAVHDTTLGPGLGGCRMREYPTLDEAVYDALRLSEGMTYKNSLAGLSLGGGKSVVVANRSLTDGRVDLFKAFGECVKSLNGAYITAEDMGTTVSDITVMSTVTQHVAGKDPENGGGGDPSPHTARGVFDGIKACLKKLDGTENLEHKKIAIQGLGAVGMHLARHLAAEGAQLIVSDTRASQLEIAAQEFAAEIVSIDEIYHAKADVFSPCAVGAILNEQTIPRLNCRIVAGAANNQLASDGDEQRLKEKGVVYAPDFAINAGGVINCADESEEGGYTPTRVAQRVAQIGTTVSKILSLSEQSGKLAGLVAIELAKERIAKARAARG